MKKFGIISSWFFNIRSSKRILGFKNWLYGKWFNYKKKTKVLTSAYDYLFSNYNFYKNSLSSMHLFFSKNYWLTPFKEQLDIYDYKSWFFNFNELFIYFVKSFVGLYKILSIDLLVNYEFILVMLKNDIFLIKIFFLIIWKQDIIEKVLLL